jgi:pyrroloquinoline quinone (PQQ) biosynthesis protein C
MSPEAQFAKQVEQIVFQRMAGRPLSRKVREGRASREELAIFAVQTYHRNLFSSRFAAANHSRCPVPELRRGLIHVIEDEEAKLPGEPPSHADLIVIFAEALGLRREVVVQSRPLPSTLAFIDSIMRLSEGHWLEGMAFRALEIGAPRGCAIWIEALKKHYGFEEDVLTWWKVHQEADVGHSNIALKAYGEHVHDESERRLVLDALDRAIGAWEVFEAGILNGAQAAREGADVGFPLPGGRS